tara:strand:+ start:3219 stop:3425 length:207 start_codon:yes stop_codon:yes gene_type:complete
MQLIPYQQNGVYKMKYKIVASEIYLQWNDKPKMEIALNEMPNDLQQLFDDWLSGIENEYNARFKKNAR